MKAYCGTQSLIPPPIYILVLFIQIDKDYEQERYS